MTRSREVSKGATRQEFVYTATTQQTTFTGNDDSSNSLSYTAGQIDVFVNGVRQAAADYTATNGTSVVLQSGAAAGDILHVVAHGTVNLASNILSGDLDLNGNELILDVDGDTSITADTDDQIDFKIAGADVAKLADSQLTLTSATASRPGILLESTNADANPSFIRFQKNGASPADNDEVGIIQFYADDDGGNVFIPADIVTTTPDVSDSSEDGKIAFRVSSAGTKAERLAVESNAVKVTDGSVFLMGGADADSVGGINCGFQIEGTSTGDSSISLMSNGGNNNGNAATIRFGKSRGTSLGSDTAVVNGDELGVILFNGADGTDRASQGAAIIATINGTAGGNDIPTMFRFQVCADGASTTTERFRIDQNGDLLGTDTSIGSLSDSRLKENIADYTYSIDTFKQFAPKTFTWKNPEMHKSGTQRGFLGQDIASTDSYWAKEEAITPKKGTADSEDNPDYDIISDNIAKISKLTEKDAMYISVIKQLIARIEALES